MVENVYLSSIVDQRRPRRKAWVLFVMDWFEPELSSMHQSWRSNDGTCDHCIPHYHAALGHTEESKQSGRLPVESPAGTQYCCLQREQSGGWPASARHPSPRLQTTYSTAYIGLGGKKYITFSITASLWPFCTSQQFALPTSDLSSPSYITLFWAGEKREYFQRGIYKQVNV